MSVHQFVAAEPPKRKANASEGQGSPKRPRPNKDIWEACTDGDLKAIQWYIEDGIDVNKAETITYARPYGYTPLWIACWWGHSEIVKELLKQPGIDVNQAETEYGQTPLYVACMYGHVEVVNALLRFRSAEGQSRDEIEVNQADKNGYTPLWIACDKGHVEVVKELLKQPGIDVNQAETEYGKTPLYLACEEGHLEVVNALLARPEIDVNQAEEDERTPLFIACQYDHVEIVNLLLEQDGIDINQANKYGETPLFIACENAHLEVVNALLRFRSAEGQSTDGIDINQATNGGVTPLSIACEYGHLEIVKELLKQPGIDINQADNNGATPLYAACDEGHDQVVNTLLRFRSAEGQSSDGIDVNKAKYNGETPLYIAYRKRHLEVVNALLAKPEIDIYQNFYLACRGGWPGFYFVKRLLQIPNINVNQRNEVGLTLLMFAAANGKTDIVRVLMDDPRVEFEDTVTLTASQLARISRHKTSANAIDRHPRSERRMANRVFVRRYIDQGRSGKREADKHIGHKVGSYFHHDVKTKLKF